VDAASGSRISRPERRPDTRLGRNNRLWHVPFNRVHAVPEQLVSGREDVFFGYEFTIQTGDGRQLPQAAIDYYVRLLGSRDALRGCFGLYRAWDATLAQNDRRRSRRLAMPVLTIGGAASWGEHVGNAMKPLADDVQSVVIPGTGHWVAETAPEETLAALTAFLAPYRNAARARHLTQDTASHAMPPMSAG
jgi:pimeloyl-ACP methyl ester carboxylesterase